MFQFRQIIWNFMEIISKWSYKNKCINRYLRSNLLSFVFNCHTSKETILGHADSPIKHLWLFALLLSAAGSSRISQSMGDLIKILCGCLYFYHELLCFWKKGSFIFMLDSIEWHFILDVMHCEWFILAFEGLLLGFKLLNK